jgi:hypothetical protein
MPPHVHTIPVSSTPGSSCFLSVHRLDDQLSLFQLPSGLELVRIHTGDAPREFPLDVGVTYLWRFNNNNGGSGALELEVIEENADGTFVRWFIVFTVMGPYVREEPFRLVRSP